MSSKIQTCVLAASMTFTTALFAETERVGDYSWQYFVRDGKAWIGSQQSEVAAIFPKPVGEVTVPSELGGYEVYGLDDYALYGCDQMSKLVIPDSVHRMGGSGVRNCTVLREVHLPENLEYIPGNSFRDCASLQEAILPPNVEKIDAYAFEGCVSLTNFVFNCGVKRIGEQAFANCRGLTKLEIPDSVTNIQQKLLLGCKNLESLSLPFVGSQRGNQHSTDAVFGWLFAQSQSNGAGCVPVRQLWDGGSRTSYIPMSLKIVTVIDETIIPTGAFQNCSNLTSVVIGNSVTNIAKGSFSGCGALESISLPFTGKSRNASQWSNGDCECAFGYIFGTDPYIGSVTAKATVGDHVVPYQVPVQLANVALTGSENLRPYAFCYCATLTNVTLNVGLKSIGHKAFHNCNMLKQIEIPDSVVTLGPNAFRGSGLEYVRVPLSVTDMTESEGWNFADCVSLHLAYVPRRFKGRLLASVFQNCAPDLQVIYYDENMKFLDETLTTEDNSSTNLIAVCTNDCRVSFKWQCSCEPMIKGNPYDYLSFEIDGIRQDFICGETDWQTKSYEVAGDGEHVFRWTYQKDEEGSAGEDCAWVKHVVVAPRVTLSFDGGEATYGVPPAALSFYADDESAVLPGYGTLSLAKHSFAGWSDGEIVYAAGAACPYQKTAQVLTAVWAANELSTPVIVAPETYEADYATVTVTADDGATIYYTLDGSVPSANGTGCRTYQGPFEIEGSATIRAIAVMANYYDSEIASFTVTRPTWTFGEYLNCPERTFTTDGDAEWVRAKGVSDDGYALRSGSVGNSQTSRLETVVYGAGTIEFRCKVDGEVVKKIVFDGLAFCIDGVQQGDLMGENTWTNKSFTVTGDGRHTLSWFYVKDEDGSGGGNDCAWLDNVVWTADDPLPPLDLAATDNDVKAIIAGLLDVRLADEISNTTAYVAFRSWVDSKQLPHALVRDAPNAWLSYVLDAQELMVKAALTNADVVIESMEPSGTVAGAFDLIVGISGAEIGEGARLAAALGVEGATELDTSAFSSEGLSITLERTADGKAKATVTPVGTSPVLFMRVKVK